MKELDKSIDKVDRDLAELAAESVAASAAMKSLDAQTNKASRSMDGLSRNVEDVEQSIDGATKSVRTHGEQVRILRAEYEQTTKRIAELDAQFLAGGDGKAIEKSLREQRSHLAAIQRIAREIQRTTGTKFSLTGDDSKPITGVLEGLLGSIPSMGGVPPQLLAGGVAIGAALAPGISAAVAGAVVGTVGAGGIVGGVLLASQDLRVRAAFVDLKDTFLQTMEPAAAAFVEPVTKSVDVLKAYLAGGTLQSVIRSSAPFTDEWVNGIIGFVDKTAKGVGVAIDRSQPLFDMWEKELPETGKAVGDFFRSISADAPGAAKALGQVFDVLQAGTRATGDAIGGLTVLNDLLQFPGVGDALSNLPLDGTLGAIGRFVNGPEIQSAGQYMTGFVNTTKLASAALIEEQTALRQTEQKTRDLAIAQLDATAKARDLKDAWNELHGAQMSLDESLKRAYDGLKQVEAAFQGAGSDSVKGDSQSAVDRRYALEQEATAAIAVAQAYLDMTGDAAGAQKKLDDFKKKAEEATGATGAARKEVDKLADSLFRLPTKRDIFVTTYIRTVEGDFRSGERDSSGRPVAAGIDTRAEGGPLDYGTPYLFGEKGPEVGVFGPRGGQMYSSADSRNLTRAWAGGGGGDARPVVINVSGRATAADLIETINTEVQARGGRLAVLGLKG